MSYDSWDRSGREAANTGESPVRKNRLVRLVAFIAAAVVVVFSLGTVVFAGSMNRVDADKWGCLYGGGLVESQGLKAKVAPGDSAGFTLGDDLVQIPASARFVKFDSDGSEDFGAKPVVGPDAAGVQVAFRGQFRIRFSEDACEWYAKYGKRNNEAGKSLNFNGSGSTIKQDNGADKYQPTGWESSLKNDVIDQYFTPAIKATLAEGKYAEMQVNTVLADGTTIWQEFGEDVAARAMAFQQEHGDTFFCGSAYTFDGKMDGKFECPEIEVIVTSIEPMDEVLRNARQSIEAARTKQNVDDAQAKTALNAQKNAAELATSQSNHDKDIAINQATNDEAIKKAQIVAQQHVADEQLKLKQKEQQVAAEQAKIDNAKCLGLVAVGESCWLNAAAEKGNMPAVIGSDVAPIVNLK